MSAEYTLQPLAPFRLDFTVWALRRTSDNIIDRWDGTTYRRVLILTGKPCEVEVTQIAPLEQPLLRIRLKGLVNKRLGEQPGAKHLEHLLGTCISLDGFYRMVEQEGQLAQLARTFKGVKPPRFDTLFEALVNAIACQQISLLLGIRLLNRLAENFGPAYEDTSGKSYGFPAPSDLAGLDPAELRSIGFSMNKSRAIVSLAQDIVEKRLDLDPLQYLDDQQALEQLSAIRGVGRWTAEYVLLRGLGRLNILPGDDVGVHRHLRNWLGLQVSDYATVMQAVQPWQPYAGLVYFHLLLTRLAEQGYIPNALKEEWL